MSIPRFMTMHRMTNGTYRPGSYPCVIELTSALRQNTGVRMLSCRPVISRGKLFAEISENTVLGRGSVAVSRRREQFGMPYGVEQYMARSHGICDIQVTGQLYDPDVAGLWLLTEDGEVPVTSGILGGSQPQWSSYWEVSSCLLDHIRIWMKEHPSMDYAEFASVAGFKLANWLFLGQASEEDMTEHEFTLAEYSRMPVQPLSRDDSGSLFHVSTTGTSTCQLLKLDSMRNTAASGTCMLTAGACAGNAAQLPWHSLQELPPALRRLSGKPSQELLDSMRAWHLANYVQYTPDGRLVGTMTSAIERAAPYTFRVVPAEVHRSMEEAIEASGNPDVPVCTNGVSTQTAGWLLARCEVSKKANYEELIRSYRRPV